MNDQTAFVSTDGERWLNTVSHENSFISINNSVGTLAFRCVTMNLINCKTHRKSFIHTSHFHNSQCELNVYASHTPVCHIKRVSRDIVCAIWCTFDGFLDTRDRIFYQVISLAGSFTIALDRIMSNDRRKYAISAQLIRNLRRMIQSLNDKSLYECMEEYIAPKHEHHFVTTEWKSKNVRMCLRFFFMTAASAKWTRAGAHGFA